MKIVLEIKVVEEDENGVFLAFTEEPDILAQGSSIKEALESYAVIYELETNPNFVTEVFGSEDNI